ncbi:MAG: hypothetical protein QXV17_07345 [Candidatus Micrarchaeaceae archaeon]
MSQEVKNPIIKIGEIIGKDGLKMRFQGIYRKVGTYGPSYLLFSEGKAYSVSGLAGKQLEDYYALLTNTEFEIEFRKFKTKRYNKEGITIDKILIKKRLEPQKKQVQLIDETKSE